LLDAAAAAEPFNAFLAREAASARLALGQARAASGDARGCDDVRLAQQALQALQERRRLAAPFRAAIAPRPPCP
ncbi:MAG: hypothetical protein ACKVQR_01470, partial [Aquabacterium sp.]